MAPEDSKAPFLRIPWVARIIGKPGTVCRVPGCRRPKLDTEDTLMAETLKTPRNIRSCICFFRQPEHEADHIDEVTTVMTVGDGMNGHPDVIHGGMLATMIDECMGIYQGINMERQHMAKVKSGHAEGELPPQEVTAFTAELKVRYLRPVRTPGAIMLSARKVKKEGRKEWMKVEVRQCQGYGEDDDGEVLVCAEGEALFIEPRTKPRAKM